MTPQPKEQDDELEDNELDELLEELHYGGSHSAIVHFEGEKEKTNQARIAECNRQRSQIKKKIMGWAAERETEAIIAELSSMHEGFKLGFSSDAEFLDIMKPLLDVIEGRINTLKVKQAKENK